jgi:TolB-like protein/DNA-binding winged helix-turn-helix (wHTH) protein
VSIEGSVRDPTLRVGVWRVDPTLDEISRDGASVKLEPRTMRVLICLAERAGQVVSVDELLDAAWKDVVVTPDSVYQAVAALRRALSDGSDNAQYIVNVVRRGYRLVAPVAPWLETASAPAGENPVTEPMPIAVSAAAAAPRPGFRWRWAVPLIAAALIVGFLVVGKSWRSAPTSNPAGAAGASGAGTSLESVAVLPFVDIGDDRDQAYFADGLTAELIDRLAKVPGFRVPAATSSFYFKGKQATVGEIARALRVGHIVEGSVRKSGKTLRITAQLLRADNGYEVWSATFDRPMADIFKVQEEIAGAVVQALKTSILAHHRPEPAPTTNVEAYTLYLRALSRLTRNGVADFEAAGQDVHAALLLDPQFASAWALLAESAVFRFDMRGKIPPAVCATAHSAVAEALRLNSTLALGHQAKGVVIQYCDADLPAAEVEFRTALEIEPGNSYALRRYSYLALQAGRVDQGLQLAQGSLAADPLNPWSYAAVGDALYSANRLGEAAAAYREAARIDTLAAGLHGMLANILLADHKPTEAVAEADAEPDADWRAETLPFALDAAGRRSDADRAIAAFELTNADDGAGEIAAFYACRHDADRALKWLQAFAARKPEKYDSFAYRRDCFGNVRSDPRFQALRQELKLP